MNPKSNACLFCKIAKGEIPSEKIYENEHVLAFLDIHPNNPGHTLIIPKEHYADFLETPDNVLTEIMSAGKKIAPKIMEAVGAHGFNTVFNTRPAAGQVVFHTHMHIIPRYFNDGHKHWTAGQYKDGEKEEVGKKIRKEISANS